MYQDVRILVGSCRTWSRFGILPREICVNVLL